MIRSLTVVCSSSFVSKYKHHLIKRLLSVYQDWGQLSDFFLSCQHQAWIDAIFVCCYKYGKHKPWHGSLEYIPFLYGYNWTICHPFYHMPPRHWRHRLEVEYSNKDLLIPTLFAIVLVWIATKQTIGTNFKMSCLVIVTKRCHVNGTPPFPSADCEYTLEFWSSR